MAVEASTTSNKMKEKVVSFGGHCCREMHENELRGEKKSEESNKLRLGGEAGRRRADHKKREASGTQTPGSFKKGKQLGKVRRGSLWE